MTTVRGDELAPVERLAVLESPSRLPDATWVLRGVVAPERYVTPDEHEALAAKPAPLGRIASTRAAMIPIRKSGQWWAMSQVERRSIFEERSHHIASSLPYLPRIARRLHHSRELGEQFDFVTWFEFSPADEAAFDELVATLRATEEWTYVEREVDVRLSAVPA
jgi:chlorite dismutase